MAGNLGNLFLLGFVIDSPHRLDTVEGLLDILEEFKDCDVLFIFETLQAATKFWGHILDKKLQTQLAASPLCSTKVTRVETKQILEQNWGYPQYRLEKTLSPTINTTELERKVLAFVVDDGIDEILAMYGAVTSATQTEKKQLDQVLFDSLGDHAMVHELRAALFDSTLGQTLARMDLKREHEENWIFDWTMLMKSWYNETCRLSRATRSTKYLPSLEHVRDPANFKAMWEYIDNGLAGYGWRSKDPYVRNLFGLFIPKDTTPPPPTRQPEPQIQQRPPSQSPSDPVVPTPSLLEVIDTQSRAMSGHAYMSSVDEESRTKGKSRPTSIHTPTQGRGPLDVNNVEEENAQKRNVFQLGRKIVKVFRRFLEDDNVEDPNLKKGQLRWNDFEKAMTKIGFRVKQTCGSSVRFDPPVDLKDSPSITFHKPHPDPVLTPGLIRRIGYRLHRRFGWKAGDFVIVDKTFQAPGDNE
ncbi:hypothetical protein JAAARDRAFT_61117 [Jaapia argillacea MUCL 33604]|uniref:Uncharacterized protein n=1 Tax=Jaapia argillacea MUCL 33604 TaxID=933084 RepID=A0A067PQZ4_9AGAM|nr:hypothetical protein JAAARDRAFT_61117 [Jaapia argillacea MUCL 33604]